MAQETRSTGRVRWFNDMKGYGFIEPEDVGPDLFVHQSSIKSDGYRTLSEGAIVEFTFAVGDDNKPKAIDVTGPNGSPIQDPRRDNSFSGSGSRRSGSFGGGWKRDNGGDSFGYSGGAAGGGCYQCGRQGHLARDCPESSSGRVGGVGGGGGSCYSCGQSGHFARECRGVGSGSGGGGACYSCGGFGHMARDCRQAVAASTGGGFGGRFGGGGGGCYNCGDPGHFARECSNRS